MRISRGDSNLSIICTVDCDWEFDWLLLLDYCLLSYLEEQLFSDTDLLEELYLDWLLLLELLLLLLLKDLDWGLISLAICFYLSLRELWLSWNDTFYVFDSFHLIYILFFFFSFLGFLSSSSAESFGWAKVSAAVSLIILLLDYTSVSVSRSVGCSLDFLLFFFFSFFSSWSESISFFLFFSFLALLSSWSESISLFFFFSFFIFFSS